MKTRLLKIPEAAEMLGISPKTTWKWVYLRKLDVVRIEGAVRIIPLNDEAFEVIVKWRARFEDPQPDHFVFPSERYGLNGEDGHLEGDVVVWNLDPQKPMGSWKTAWKNCRKAAGVWCRLHDLRHTFIPALGQARVPEPTMIALAGWMSRKMLERYSHTRTDAKRKAVKKLPRRRG